MRDTPDPEAKRRALQKRVKETPEQKAALDLVYKAFFAKEICVHDMRFRQMQIMTGEHAGVEFDCPCKRSKR